MRRSSEMEPNPPPPPPLPPPLLPSTILSTILSTNSIQKQSSVMNSLTNSNQSTNYSNEDFKTMLKNQLFPLSQSKVVDCHYAMPKTIVDGVLQRGPCCGMVALHLGHAQLLVFGNDDNQGRDKSIEFDNGKGDFISASADHEFVSVESIIDEAKTKGFTLFGEMFSCENMASLARTFLPRSTNVSVQHSNILETDNFAQTIKTHLRKNGLILIPYDKDVNFGPCESGGKKAHWALILGMIEVKVGKGNDEVDGVELFVAARHGKSLRLAFWRLKDLLKSNSQLRDYDWDKLEENFRSAKPVVPMGGLEEGLKGKMVFIG